MYVHSLPVGDRVLDKHAPPTRKEGGRNGSKININNLSLQLKSNFAAVADNISEVIVITSYALILSGALWGKLQPVRCGGGLSLCSNSMASLEIS